VAHNGRATLVVTVRHGARIPPCHSHTPPPLLANCVAISKWAAASRIRVIFHTGDIRGAREETREGKDLGGQPRKPAANGREQGFAHTKRDYVTANLLTGGAEKAMEGKEGECIRMGEQEKGDEIIVSLGLGQEDAIAEIAAHFRTAHREELNRILHRALTLSVSQRRIKKSQR
jgi:hypothetical protein